MHVSGLEGLFGVQLNSVEGERHLTCELDAADCATAASMIAESIVRRRIGVNPRVHDLWHEQRSVAPAYSISDVDQELLVAGVLTNVGIPDDPAPDLHCNGLVAESVWAELVAAVDAGLGLPLRVEGHDWSVTDSGGDGLTIYRIDDQLLYRLWESKHHLAQVDVRQTVNKACRQVQDRHLSYLSRFSLIAQQLTATPELARFYARLAELWVDNDPAVGVGISIGTDVTGNAVGCFGNVHTYFQFDRDKLDGHLHVVGDFKALVDAVRDELWKGCGLWIGH